MPWTMGDAPLNTKKANTPAKKKQFAAVANAVLKKTGDDVKALKIAKSAVAKRDNRGAKERMTKATTKAKKY